MLELVFQIHRLKLQVFMDWSDGDGYVLLRGASGPFLWLSIWDFKDMISACLAQSNDGWSGWRGRNASIKQLQACWSQDTVYEIRDANNDLLKISMSELNDLSAAYFVIVYLSLILDRSPKRFQFYDEVSASTIFCFCTDRIFVTFSVDGGFAMFTLNGSRKLSLSDQECSELELFDLTEPLNYFNKEGRMQLNGRTLVISTLDMPNDEPNVYNLRSDDWRFLILCTQLYFAVCKFVERCSKK